MPSSWQWFLFTLAILCTQQKVQASISCNSYHFGLQGAAQCGLQWWQSNNFEENTADIEPQLTDFVSTALESFSVNPLNVSHYLKRSLKTNSNDPLRKLVETAALAEPYILYAVMDAAHGFELTRADRQKLGFPESLAEERNMKKLYQNYFTESCRSDILRSLITCLTRWTDENCEEEDKASVGIGILINMADCYCKDQTPKTELMSELNEDFGEVYAGVAKSLGVVKDPQSPYLFNLSKSSMFYNQTALQKLSEVYLSSCGYLIESFTGGSQVGGEDPFADPSPSAAPRLSSNQLHLMFTNESDIGIGVMIERLSTFQSQFTNCAVRAWNNFMPGFFTEHSEMFEHLDLLIERYGGTKLSLAEPERGDVRHTVMVYGDPHMKAYKIPGTLTCPALGSQTYLSNEYFKLIGTAEPACDAPACSSATYVTSVKLSFPRQAVTYQTDRAGRMPSTKLTSDDMSQEFTERGSIKLEVLGSSVRIIDKNSAAVFLFSKFRHTYQIAVRLSESILDNSFGLLIIGCPNPTDITSTNSPGEPARRRRDVQCETACREVEGEFRDTCVFDCKTTGDLEVANITKNVMVMETFAEEKDQEIFKLYPTTTEKAAGDDTGGSNMFVPNMLMIFLVAVLSRLFIKPFFY